MQPWSVDDYQEADRTGSGNGIMQWSGQKRVTHTKRTLHKGGWQRLCWQSPENLSRVTWNWSLFSARCCCPDLMWRVPWGLAFSPFFVSNGSAAKLRDVLWEHQKMNAKEAEHEPSSCDGEPLSDYSLTASLTLVLFHSAPACMLGDTTVRGKDFFSWSAVFSLKLAFLQVTVQTLALRVHIYKTARIFVWLQMMHHRRFCLIWFLSWSDGNWNNAFSLSQNDTEEQEDFVTPFAKEKKITSLRPESLFVGLTSRQHHFVFSRFEVAVRDNRAIDASADKATCLPLISVNTKSIGSRSYMYLWGGPCFQRQCKLRSFTSEELTASFASKKNAGCVAAVFDNVVIANFLVRCCLLQHLFHGTQRNAALWMTHDFCISCWKTKPPLMWVAASFMRE